MTEASITLFGLERNPAASVTIFGMSFYWSGLLLAAAFLVAVGYAVWRGKKFGVSGDMLTDVMICAIPAGIVGARLFYVLGHLSSFTDDLISILHIWDGGMELVGGAVFALAAIWLYCRKKMVSLGAVLDTLAPGLLVGGAVGVWGNYFQRTNYGCETTLPWKMGLTMSGETVYVHPLFLYASLWFLIGFIALHILSVKRTRRYDGQLAAMGCVWYGLYPVMTVPLEAGYAETFSLSRLAGALMLCVGIVILVHEHLHGKEKPLFVDVTAELALYVAQLYEAVVVDEVEPVDDAEALRRLAKGIGNVPEEAEETKPEEEDDEEGFEPFGENPEEKENASNEEL